MTATAWHFMADIVLIAATTDLLSLLFKSSAIPGACIMSCLACLVGMIFVWVIVRSLVYQLLVAIISAQVCLGGLLAVLLRACSSLLRSPSVRGVLLSLLLTGV